MGNTVQTESDTLNSMMRQELDVGLGASSLFVQCLHMTVQFQGRLSQMSGRQRSSALKRRWLMQQSFVADDGPSDTSGAAGNARIEQEEEENPKNNA
jgi:hypothetical protein